MTVASASKLDTEKFRKVHRLMTGGATEGERSAARARAEAIAAKAGMSLKEAVSSLDAKSKVEPTAFDFGEWMEAREPGWRAQRASEAAQRRADIMARHGSKAKLFEPTERELKLEKAIAPLVSLWGWWGNDDGRRYRFAKTIDGVDVDGVWIFEKTTPRIAEAVRGAYPWPATLQEALEEVQAWDQLWADRSFLFSGEWSHLAGVDCRIELLKHELDKGRPASSWEDVQARFDWKRHEFRSQWTTPQELNDPFMDRLEADIAALRAQASKVDTPQRDRTPAEKRAAVLSMLDAHPELSDREIARRVGVSPQTVNTWRRKR